MPPKRQTSQKNFTQDSNVDVDIAKQQAEERRRKLEAEKIAKLDSQKRVEEDARIRREQEEQARRKQEEEERAVKKVQEEQQRQKEEEERRRKQEEDEVRRAAEDRKKKMEAERRRQLEEQALKAEEERKRLEQEKKQKEEEELKALDEFKKSEPVLQIAVSSHPQPSYDLLGGEAAEDHEEETPQHHHHHQHQAQYDTTEDVYSNYSEFGSVNAYHRQIPSRGQLDSLVDDKLDSIPTVTRITKTGKTDGVYLFGTRIMKTKLDKAEVKVLLGASLMPIDQFVTKFDRVESTKMRGLMSAVPMIQFISAKPKSRDQ